MLATLYVSLTWVLMISRTTPSERQESFQRVLAKSPWGKPQFNIEVKTTAKGKFKVIYSFRGHRFLATSSDAWAESLAKGHHDFSVGEMGTPTLWRVPVQTFWLKSLCLCPWTLHPGDVRSNWGRVGLPRNWGWWAGRIPRLYGLHHKICARQPELLDPWPFKDKTISVSFEYWSMELTQADKGSCKALDAEQHHKWVLTWIKSPRIGGSLTKVNPKGRA